MGRKYEICFKLDVAIIDEKFPNKKKKIEPLGDTQLLRGSKDQIREQLLSKIEDIMEQLDELYIGG